MGDRHSCSASVDTYIVPLRTVGDKLTAQIALGIALFQYKCSRTVGKNRIAEGISVTHIGWHVIHPDYHCIASLGIPRKHSGCSIIGGHETRARATYVKGAGIFLAPLDTALDEHGGGRGDVFRSIGADDKICHLLRIDPRVFDCLPGGIASKIGGSFAGVTQLCDMTSFYTDFVFYFVYIKFDTGKPLQFGIVDRFSGHVKPKSLYSCMFHNSSNNEK